MIHVNLLWKRSQVQAHYSTVNISHWSIVAGAMPTKTFPIQIAYSVNRAGVR